ncbi:MAG: hypothetical protein ABSA58_26760 [Acetobacteraceae bacterium]
MRKLPWLAAMFSLLSGVAAAEPQIKVPECPALAFWAPQVNVRDTFNVAPRLTLPKAFQDVYIVPLFGVAVLAWNQDDVQAASQALAACYQDSGKRHDQVTTAALGNANHALLGLVPHTNDLLRKAKNDSDAIRGQLEAMPPSADLARGIDAFLNTNPTAPDMNTVRGLPREIADPIWRLIGLELTMTDADQQTLRQALDDRRHAVEAKLTDDATKQIAAATADAGGIIRLMEIHQRLTVLNDADVKAKLTGDADDEARKIRETLRLAKPPVWVPPTCLDLYRWSGAPNAGGVTPIGRRSVVMAFLDARVVPVFGISVGDWTDQDIARFKALRAICRAASLPPQGRLPELNLETIELVQAGNRGRWIDVADQQIADARAGIADYHKARQDVAALEEKIQALPENEASLVTLGTLAKDPVLTAVTQDDRAALINAVNAKRAAIGTRIADAAVKGLDGIKVAATGDLGALFAYAAQTLPTLPDQHAQQIFAAAVNHDLDEITKRLLPEFNARLNAVPVGPDGLAEVKTVDSALGDGGRLTALKPFHDAAHARYDFIVKSVHDRACSDLLSSVGARGDASQDIWDGDKGMKLGDFICGLAEHGITVNSFSGAGLFSGTSTLKMTPLLDQIEIVSLHKAEIRSGQSMLVGYKIVDANGQPVSILGAAADPKGGAAVSIAGWEIYARQARGESPTEVEECKPVMASPPSKLGPGKTLFWLHCGTMPAVSRALAAAPK